MREWIRFVLYLINFLLYLLIIALWIAIPNELVLNITTSVFVLSFTMILAIFERKKLRKYYKSFWFKSLVSTLISAMLLIGILGLVNYVSFKHPTQIDFSENRINSLTEQSINVLKKIDQELVVKIFERKAEAALITSIWELYRMSNPLVRIETVDLEIRPDLVKQYAIEKAGTVVLEYAKRREYVQERSELAYTNAIIKLTRAKDPEVFFTTGHKEINLKEKSKDGLFALGGILEKALFNVREINLATLTAVPDEADILVIWGPKTSFLSQEIEVINRYLKNGGKLLVALDPNLNEDPLGTLREMIAQWGVRISNDLVIDRLNHISGSNGTVPLIKKFEGGHSITKSLTGSVFFPLVSSVVATKSEGRFSAFAVTSPFPASWAEKTPREIVDGKIIFNENIDSRGPVVVSATWESSLLRTKMVVFGNSTFVSNSYINFTENFNLFVNAVGWLTSDDLLPSFNLAVGETRPVLISSIQLNVIFYFSVIVAPLALFALALFVYMRRRKL